jgi:predicted DNA-binding protein YlxM (UPF0122 family)
MQGQETLVLKNVDSDGKNSDWVVGSSAILFLPRADSDAFYLSTDGTGIGAMRQALLDDRLAAGEFGIKLTDDSTTSQSGEAMRVRMASKTASLTGIAKTGAEGLKQVLKYCAEIVGANPDEIEIEIDADFSAERIGGQELAQYMTAINEGAPLAKESLHSKLKEGGITEKTYEEEIALIEKEKEDQGLVTEMTQTVPTESPDLQQGDEEEQATQNPEKNQQTN